MNPATNSWEAESHPPGVEPAPKVIPMLPSAGGSGAEPASLTDLRRRWGVMTPADLDHRVRDDPDEYLVADIIPARRIVLAVGESGVGKSPLMYQLSLAVASGAGTLGRKVRQGKVLYLDAENGLAEMDDIVKALTKHLGLSEQPDDFVMFSLNSAPSAWGQVGHGIEDLIEQARPALVVVDTAASFWPGLESKNEAAGEAYSKLRRLISRIGCTIVIVHHLRKPSEGEPRQSIEDIDVRRWFDAARGASSLVNCADVRLGIDRPGVASHGKADVVVGGFGHIRGAIPIVHLGRVLDEEGNALGYRLVGRVELFSDDVQQLYAKLPEIFAHKDAKTIYGRGSQATTDALRKLQSAALIRPAGVRGKYEKLKPADSTD